MRLRAIFPAAALLAASLSFSSAYASPIFGSFSLNSFDGGYVGGTAATATGLDFGSPNGGAGNGYGTNGAANVGNATGSFAGLTLASVADISLGAFANPFTSNPFISFAGSALTVNFSNAAYTRSDLGTTVTIAGIATFSDGIAGDENTGTFSLATSSQNGSPASTLFTFTGNVAAPPVAVTPEPSSLALLGTGLVSAATLALRRRKLMA